MTQNTILLIDDDDDFLRALAQRCKSIGLEVEQTRNLLTATLKTAKHVPDIICVDVQMPTGSGLSYCEALANDPHSSGVAVVVLTGQTDVETRQACKRLHAHYVEKTVDYWSQLGPLLRRLATESLGKCESPSDSIVSEGHSADLVRLVSRTEIHGRTGLSSTKKILVADDDEDMVRMLSTRCALMGCSVIGVNNAFDAINEIRNLRPDLVCLDVNMPGGDGLSVCEMMAGDKQLRKIPVIILTGRSNESTIRRCHDLLVYYVEKSAHTWERVGPLVRELLRIGKPARTASLPSTERPVATETESDTHSIHGECNLADAVFSVLGAGSSTNWDGPTPGDDPAWPARQENIPWVLCIDDDVDFVDALKIRLEDHGVAVVRAHTGMAGFRLAFTTPASAILLDFNMPDGQGDYILGRLKDNPVTRDIPVVVISGTRDKLLERRMLAMGATAFLHKPINFEQLRKQLAKYVDILGRTKEPLVSNTLGSAPVYATTKGHLRKD